MWAVVFCWVSLASSALARKLAFPLLGLQVVVPDVYTIEQAGPARVNLARKNSAVKVSVYRVEFGNLEKLTPTHEQQILRHLRERLGRGSRVEMTPLLLSGRKGRQLIAAGTRFGAPWGISAGWVFRGGQAWVVEVLYPSKQQAEGQTLFHTICHDLIWITPERG